MMKENFVGPLLSLLLLAVTPRNSCANPTAYVTTVIGNTGGAPAVIIANDVNEGANVLTVAITGLQVNTPQRSQFDQSVCDLENDILVLPVDLVEDRLCILTNLYSTQDKLELLRTDLEVTADMIISHCNTLIKNWDIIAIDPKTVVDLSRLRYNARKFHELSVRTTGYLDEASNKTEAILSLLATAKALLLVFNSNLEKEKGKIRAVKESAENEIQLLENKLMTEKNKTEKMLIEEKITTDICIQIIDCTFTLRGECKLTSITMSIAMQTQTNAAVDDRKKLECQLDNKEEHQKVIKVQSELLVKIKQAQNSTITLLDNVKGVKQYLYTEIRLITEWEIKLDLTASDNDVITNDDIAYGIIDITANLKELVKACEAYKENDNVIG